MFVPFNAPQENAPVFAIKSFLHKVIEFITLKNAKSTFAYSSRAKA